MTRTLSNTAVAIAALAIAWNAAEPGKSTPADASDRPTKVSVAPPSQKAGPYHGMAVQLHGGRDIYEKYHRLIPEISELGADTVLFVVHGWQEHAGTLDLHIDSQKTADAGALGKLIDLAREHNLRTILMPIVLLQRPRNNEWRGKILPENHDWDTWFRRYTRFIVYFARLAEKHNVAAMTVGSELIKTEVYTDRWKRVIEEVRQNYRGELGYSANWDHYQTTKIGFWPQLDFVGMTSYYELADGPNPSIEEINENWVRFKNDILSFQREVNKPIIFTEVGWCSQEGAAHEGWNYYANQKATAKGLAEQALLYQSFMNVWSDAPGIGGTIWWEWDTSAGGDSDYNYTPRGKPAEKLLRDWFVRKKLSPPTLPAAQKAEN